MDSRAAFVRSPFAHRDNILSSSHSSTSLLVCLCLPSIPVSFFLQAIIYLIFWKSVSSDLVHISRVTMAAVGAAVMGKVKTEDFEQWLNHVNSVCGHFFLWPLMHNKLIGSTLSTIKLSFVVNEVDLTSWPTLSSPKCSYKLLLIKLQVLGKSEAEEAFRPWWDTLSDYLL